MGGQRRFLLALLAASVVAPSSAGAATVSYPYAFTQTVVDVDGAEHRLPWYRLRFDAAAGENNDLSVADGASHRSVLVKDAGAPLEAGENCKKVAAGVECTVPGNGFAGSGEAHLGDGDDRAFLDSASSRIPGFQLVDGGDGADDLTVRGYGIALDGGPGRDRLAPGDSYGAQVTYAGRTEPVRVTLDGIANDGAAGEGDDVVDAYTVYGGDGDDVIAGPAAEGAHGVQLFGGFGDDALTGGSQGDMLDGGDGHNTIDGGAGDDTIVGGSEAETVAGGAGRDRLQYAIEEPVRVSLDPALGDATYTHAEVEEVGGGRGADTILGSGGPDTIDGGEGGTDAIFGMGGDDTITGSRAGGSYLEGGPGEDQVVARASGDQVELRDGEADRVECFAGFVGIVDIDPVDAGAFRCSPFAFFRGPSRVRVPASGRFALPMGCPRAARCEGTLLLRLRGRVIARRTFTRAPGARFPLRFRLSARQRRELTGRRRLRVSAALTVRLAAEPARAHVATRRVTLLAARRARR